MNSEFTNVKEFFKRIWRPIISFFIISSILAFTPIIIIINRSKDSIISVEEIGEGDYEVAIIFGAGVDNDSTLSEQLEDRLITGAELYTAGKVKSLVLSGNNSEQNNYETDIMRKYLIEEMGVPDYAIMTDPWGYRTYDTCARANEVYGIEKAILVTQKYHLYRALTLCHSQGVESIGIKADIEEYGDGWVYLGREFFAIHKAFIDLYINEPDYFDGL